MKKICSFLMIATLLIFGALQLTVYGDQSYDTDKTVTRNIYDAIAAIANADTPFLNDVLFVDGDRTDDYTADGSLAAPYKTIQAADTASVSGDVIIVAPGAYAEVVTLNAGVHLFGWNVSGATLTGEFIIFNGSTIEFSGNLVLENGEIIKNDTNGQIDITGALVVSSTSELNGDITLENDETISNSSDGTIALTGAVTVSGDLGVDTDVLNVDTTNDIVEVNGWYDAPHLAVAASPYTLNAASKASNIIINYTDTGAASLVLASDLLVDGRSITIKDGELNAGSNNITIGTEGAETIDEAETYVMNANGEAVTLFTDGSNWFVFGGFVE